MEEESAPIVVNVDTGDETIETPEPEPVVVVVETPEETPEETPVVVAELPNPMLAVDNRFQMLEARMDAAEAAIIEHATDISSRSVADHSHPVPSELAALSEHLDALKKEEVPPSRERWYNKKLWG